VPKIALIGLPEPHQHQSDNNQHNPDRDIILSQIEGKVWIPKGNNRQKIPKQRYVFITKKCGVDDSLCRLPMIAKKD
jgi:hypothetical protein